MSSSSASAGVGTPSEDAITSLEDLLKQSADGNILCHHPRHGQSPTKIDYSLDSICSHANDCMERPGFASVKAATAFLKKCVLSLIVSLDQGRVVHCKACGHLLHGKADTLKRHFTSCRDYSCGTSHISEHLVSTRGSDNIVFASVVELTNHPETKHAIESGVLRPLVVLACPARDCFAAFKTGDKESLHNHLRHHHKKDGHTPDTYLDLAARAKNTTALRLTDHKFVRIIDKQASATTASAPPVLPFVPDDTLARRNPQASKPVVSVALPPLPDRAIVPSGKMSVTEALAEADLSYLPPKTLRTTAPSYLIGLGWHVSASSTLIGSSNAVARTFEVGEKHPGGLRFGDMCRVWVRVLEELSAVARLAYSIDPRIAGSQDLPSDMHTSNEEHFEGIEDSDNGTQSSGSRRGRPILGLSARQVQQDSVILARLALFLNGSYALKQQTHAARLPFPSSLAGLSTADVTSQILQTIKTLEFDDAEAQGITFGPLALFLWASCLICDGGEITAFKKAPSVAAITNTLNHILSYACVYFRAQPGSGGDKVSHINYFKARSQALIASVRARLQADLGKERRASVHLDAAESAKCGFAIISVSHLELPLVAINHMTIGGGVAKAHKRLKDVLAEVFETLGLDARDARLVSDPCLCALSFEGGRNDIRDVCLRDMQNQDLCEGLKLGSFCCDAAKRLSAAQQGPLWEQLSEVQDCILFLLYFSPLGASRGPDILNVSFLSQGHPQFVSAIAGESGSGKSEIYCCRAPTESNIQVGMGAQKTTRGTGVSRSLPRQLDRFSSHFLAIHCILLQVREAGDKEPQFPCIWRYTSVQEILHAFPRPCSAFLGIALSLGEARQVRREKSGSKS